jgi:BirA family biotin operon repressor/biotin-[acetyl-CoA-carboxylase] ligase
MFTEVLLEKVDSTHLHAVREAEKGVKESLFFYAHTQTHGVGRKGDGWIASGIENILGTFLFTLPQGLPLHNLGQLLAYAIITVLEKEGFVPLFKWPNDILLSYKKVSGILCTIKGDKAVVSYGLNVNMNRETLDLIPIKATSLFEESQRTFSLENLRQLISEAFTKDLRIFCAEGFTPFFPRLAKKLAFIEKTAVIEGEAGIIKGLSPDGRLIFERNGSSHLLASGSLEIWQ